MFPIKKIILHHSATKDSGTVSWQAIRRFHIHECAWDDIGYHYGIEWIQDQPWAEPHVEILMGRMPGTVGAHTAGHNKGSIGICAVGNFDIDPPYGEIWDTTLVLVRWLLKMYALKKGDVYGHRDFANKTCPGKLWDLDLFRKQL
jgi:N-acetylmuramoyl-L-alanine amidase